MRLTNFVEGGEQGRVWYRMLKPNGPRMLRIPMTVDFKREERGKRMKFDTMELIQRVTSERAKHRKLFEEAVDRYKEKVLVELEEFARRIKAGEQVRIISSLPVPEEHTEDFDRVLDMLQMTTDKQIELDEAQFDCYVRGRWHWMQSFASNTISYTRHD